MNRRVVVTGLGAISSLGHSVSAFWDSIVRCRSGIGPIESVDRSLIRFENGAEVRGYRPDEHFTPKDQQLYDRFSQFALLAAREAMGQAGVEWTDALRRRTAVVTGTGIGGEATHEEVFQTLYRDGKNRVHPLSIPRIMPNAATSAISMEFGLRGPALTLSTACASSNHAIGHAFWMIRGGLCDLAVTGGSETPFCYGFLKTWEAMRVVASDTCRPFSRDRKGMILGEGSAMLVLETLESARARGAEILAEIVGFGMSADAGHITTPDPEGARRAMEAALEDSGVAPERIGYINAHGTGTLVNDSMEAGVIRALFGDHAGRLAVSSTKSLHGHGLGAGSAFEAVATILALKHGILPPTANFTEPDPECDLDVVPNASRPADIEYALSNAFAFGGLNAVLAFRKWTGD